MDIEELPYRFIHRNLCNRLPIRKELYKYYNRYTIQKTIRSYF
jgi:hypothetical protein